MQNLASTLRRFGVTSLLALVSSCEADSPDAPLRSDASGGTSDGTANSTTNAASATPSSDTVTASRDSATRSPEATSLSTTQATFASESSASESTSNNATSRPRDSTSSTGSAAITSAPPDPGAGPSIKDGTLFVDGAPFRIQGVNWNPVPKGATHPQGLDYAGSVIGDAPLMRAAGINAVRTYEHLDDQQVLDALYAHGIYVFTTVYGFWQDEPSVVTERVAAVKDHKAVLGYVLGNEWNYNQLYSNGEISTLEARDRINAAAALVKQADPIKPVCTIYGELADLESMIQNMPNIDMWGINAYRGIGFGDLFEQYSDIGTKPMFLGEFGADAYNANIGAYDAESQAEATANLIDEIGVAFASGKTVGGFIFEWSDEWWKDGEGSPSEHDVGGIAPGGGPHPDATFNEEWWGIVDIDRIPRPAYAAVKAAYAPQ